MRNPKRIPEVLAALQKAWERHPDWRLGQVISNALGPGPQDVFFPEDDEWKRLLEAL